MGACKGNRAGHRAGASGPRTKLKPDILNSWGLRSAAATASSGRSARTAQASKYASVGVF
eukprot:7281763-Prymnesium_polylepis.1